MLHVVASLAVVVAVTVAVVAALIAARAMRAAEAAARDVQALEERVLSALDVLDAEVGAATEAKRILSEVEPRDRTVYVVPAARWVANQAGRDRRITGVVVALALIGSAAVVNDWPDSSEPRPSPPTASAVATTAPTTTTPPTLPTTTSLTGAGEPPAKAPPTATPTRPPVTATQPTTTAPPTTAPLPDSLGQILIALQVGDEVQFGVFGEGEVHDLANILAAEIGDDTASAEDLLDVIEGCLDGDVASPSEDCSDLDSAELLD